MRKLCFMIFLVFQINQIAFAQNEEILTNARVIELYQKRLPVSTVVNKIKTTKNTFDVSTDALISLSDKKIPEDIINAMVEAAGGPLAVKKVNSNDPLTYHESGVYMQVSTTPITIKEMDASVCSQSKSNSAAQRFVSGLINAKSKVTISGAESHFQIDSTTPNPMVFYFYFDPGKNSLNSSTVNWDFQNATSPNEFMLVKTDVKGNSREFVTSKDNIVASQSGVDDKQVKAFDYIKLAPGIYKVTVKNKLVEGEYCWMFSGKTPKDGGAKVYDFGLK